MILHQVEDEHGNPWLVAKGDPAFPVVQQLRSAWYTWIVLPEGVLRTGSLGSGTGAGVRATLDKIHRLRYNKVWKVEELRRLYRLAEVLLALGKPKSPGLRLAVQPPSASGSR